MFPPLRYVLCVVLFNTVSLHYKYVVLYLQRLVFRYYNINLFSTVLGDYGTEEECPTPDESEPGVEVPSMSLKHSILHCVTLTHCKSAVTMVFLYLYKQYKFYHIQNNKLPYIPRRGLMITYQSLSIGNYST